AVDSRGGTYAPTNPIVFGGAGLRLEVTPTNELDVTPKFYVDGEIDDALNYIDDEVEDLTTYVNAQDAATLASANAYSDLRATPTLYSPTTSSIVNETRIENIVEGAVTGMVTRIGGTATTSLITIYFEINYEANASGIKTVQIPCHVQSGWTLIDNFTTNAQALGHGVAFH